MRDPERIHRILAYIEDIWLMYPDMRLGQLLANAVDGSIGVEPMNTKRPFETNTYYIEDDFVEERLSKYLEYWAAIEAEGED